MIKLDLVLGVVTLALWLFCVFDVIVSPEPEVRNLPKLGWLLLVLIFPLVGSVAWLVAGRPQRAVGGGSSYERQVTQFPEYDRPGRAAASTPEHDDEFLRRVRERAEEQRRVHREKQAQERRTREAEQERRRRQQSDDA